MPKSFSLSKSKLNAYHRCKKWLWLAVRGPKVEVGAATQVRFNAGERVGELARAEHPNGVLIGLEDGYDAAIERTKAVLAAKPKRPVFEATMQHADVLVRADLLTPVRGGFHMAEVKSTTKVHDYHLPDVAVQTWVMRRAGVPVKSVELRHLDNQFVYRGSGNYQGLFASGDVQDDVEKLQSEVPKWVKDAQATLRRAEPDVEMGDHCRKPYPCPFQDHCSSLAGPGPAYPVTLLPGQRGKRIGRELVADGILDLRKVPVSRLEEDEKLRRIHAATKHGKPYLDSAAARSVIAAWPYPHYHFDFETIQFAVPRWPGTRPYDQVPFQWSCHIDDGSGKLKHLEFLDLSGDDPSRACAEAMVKALGTKGAVIAYSADFEKERIKWLAKRFSDLAKRLLAINERVVDILRVVDRHYYHRDMQGSYSLKDVLPTVAPELDYSRLGEVQDGVGAGLAYLEAIDPETGEERREALRVELLKYCQRDTNATVEVERELVGRARETCAA